MKKKIKSALFNKLPFKCKDNNAYKCLSGPWVGETIFMQTGKSLEFTVKRMTGSYRDGLWIQS